jgi:hypothetical protein
MSNDGCGCHTEIRAAAMFVSIYIIPECWLVIIISAHSLLYRTLIVDRIAYIQRALTLNYKLINKCNF